MTIYTNIYLQQIQSICLPNKYTNWYCAITHNAQLRAATRKSAKLITNSTIEKHHVLPKCFELGGEKDVLNYAYLTPREHFVCHWLLTKMTSGQQKQKMCYALRGMRRNNKNQERYDTKITARVYENLKSNLGPISEETRIRKSTSMKGKNRELKSKETREKMSASAKGRTPWNKGVKLGPMSEDQKQKLRGIRGPQPNLIGRTPWNKGKESNKKGISQQQIICPHCNKSGGINAMKRYHLNNCKQFT